MMRYAGIKAGENQPNHHIHHFHKLSVQDSAAWKDKKELALNEVFDNAIAEDIKGYMITRNVFKLYINNGAHYVQAQV
jgi:hypothetical protein